MKISAAKRCFRSNGKCSYFKRRIIGVWEVMSDSNCLKNEYNFLEICFAGIFEIHGIIVNWFDWPRCCTQQIQSSSIWQLEKPTSWGKCKYQILNMILSIKIHIFINLNHVRSIFYAQHLHRHPLRMLVRRMSTISIFRIYLIFYSIQPPYWLLHIWISSHLNFFAGKVFDSINVANVMRNCKVECRAGKKAEIGLSVVMAAHIKCSSSLSACVCVSVGNSVRDVYLSAFMHCNCSRMCLDSVFVCTNSHRTLFRWHFAVPTLHTAIEWRTEVIRNKYYYLNFVHIVRQRPHADRQTWTEFVTSTTHQTFEMQVGNENAWNRTMDAKFHSQTFSDDGHLVFGGFRTSPLLFLVLRLFSLFVVLSSSNRISLKRIYTLTEILKYRA